MPSRLSSATHSSNTIRKIMTQLQFSNLEQIIVLAQVMAAMFLGGLIGLDREAEQKPAGLRTHMLVAGASALMISLGELTVGELALELGGQVITADPIRIIAAIITGVSFLGAGTIIRTRQTSEEDIKGLTTAASLLFVSVVGISIALSEWIIAIGSTLLALIVLRLIPTIEQLIKRNKEDASR